MRSQVRLEAGYVDAFELNQPVGRWTYPADAAEQSGFSGTISAEHRDQLAFADLKRHIMEDVARAIEGIDAPYAKHH
jgi:hypothetical protein